MSFGLPKLTGFNHGALALLLVLAATMLISDITVPAAVELRNAGDPGSASLLTYVPAFTFLTALVGLLPRTGNDSRHATIRVIGKIPLLVRYILIATLSYGIAAAIKIQSG